MEIADKNGDGSVATIIILVLNCLDCSGLLPEKSFLGDKKTHKQKGELTWLLILWTGGQNYNIMNRWENFDIIYGWSEC